MGAKELGEMVVKFLLKPQIENQAIIHREKDYKYLSTHREASSQRQ